MSDQKLRIFISHCCTGVPEDMRILEQFIAALDPIATVLVDTKFSHFADPRWRENVRTWVSSCHIAVSLFGIRAGKCDSDAGFEHSFHVHDEAIDLSRRQSNQKSFNWVIVGLDTISFQALKEVVGDRYANISEDALLPPDKALERIRKLTTTLKPLNCFDETLKDFAVQVIKILEPEIQPVPNVVETLFQFDEGYFSDRDLIEMAVAMLIRDGSECLSRVHSSGQKLKLRPKCQAELMECLAPLWIPLERARMLRMYAEPSSQMHAFTLQSSKSYEIASKYTARWHVSRAWNTPYGPELHTLSSINGIDTHRLRAEIRTQLETLIEADSDESFDVSLREHIVAFGPILIALPPLIEFPKEFISELKHRYPGVVWIHTIQSDVSAESPILSDAPPLEPPLDFEREKQAIRYYRQAHKSTQSMQEISP